MPRMERLAAYIKQLPNFTRKYRIYLSVMGQKGQNCSSYLVVPSMVGMSQGTCQDTGVFIYLLDNVWVRTYLLGISPFL